MHKNIEELEIELDFEVEELESKIAPGELVWPFGGCGGWGR